MSRVKLNKLILQISNPKKKIAKNIENLPIHSTTVITAYFV